MKKTFFSLILLVACTGCTTQQSKMAPVALGPNSTTSAGTNALPQAAVTITGSDRGAFVSLKPKGMVTVALDANHGAGYGWILARPLDPKILELVSQPANQPTQSPEPGQPGISTPVPEQWVFRTVGPGTTKVHMVYGRPEAPLAETVSFDFTVNAE